MARRPISRFLGFFCVAILLGLSQAKPDLWLISSAKHSPINSGTTFDELVRRYGVKNVVEREIDIGEGETEPGVVLFPDDPHRSMDILWKDPQKKNGPKRVMIHGRASRWRAASGISLGTTLKELEALNAKPFTLRGFGWDYSGTVDSWEGGRLEKEIPRVVVRLSPSDGNQAPEELEGDGVFSSNNKLMQKMNPRVYFVLWEFSK